MQQFQISLFQVIDYFTDEYNNVIMQLFNDSLQSQDQLIHVQIRNAELKAALKEAERDKLMYKDTIVQILNDPTQKEMESTIQNLLDYLKESQITCREKIDELFKCDKKSGEEQKEDDHSTPAEALMNQTSHVLCEFMQLAKEDAQKKAEKMEGLLLSLQKSEEQSQKTAQIIDTLTKAPEYYKMNSSNVQRQTACVTLMTKLQELQIHLEEKKCGTACRLAIDVYSLLKEDRYSISHSKISSTAQLVKMFFTEVQCSMQGLLGCPKALVDICSGMYDACKKQEGISYEELLLSKEAVDPWDFSEVSNH